MAEDVCVCPKCGKKYKLKEGFDAKSFSCKACGATVWVGGKAPAPAPVSRRSGGAPKPRRAGRAAAAPAAGGRAGRRGRGREAPEHEEEGGRRGHGREKPKSNTNILMAIGAVAVIGIVVVIAVMSGKKETPAPQPPPAVAEQPTGTTGPSDLAASGTGAKPSEQAQPAGAKPPAEPAGQKPPSEGEAAPPEPEDAPPSPEGGESPTKLGGGNKKKADGPSPNDPPATLGHLETTPPEQRKQIDELVAVLLDPQAGREVHEAKEKLAAIGKPAFLPILGKMAAIRDTITDTDTMEERLIESSLMLADQCLRQMDGYLDAHDKAIIRPGTDKKYVKYILVLHYRRWKDGLGSTPLKDMPEMPGPFDPTKSPKQSGGDDEEEGK